MPLYRPHKMRVFFARNNNNCIDTMKTIVILGVSAVGRKFRAHIQINGEIHHLGHHATQELAHAAYLTAKRKFHEFGAI